MRSHIALLNLPGDLVVSLVFLKPMCGKPYVSSFRNEHTQFVHTFEAEDYAASQAMCHDLPESVENDNLMENCLVQ